MKQITREQAEEFSVETGKPSIDAVGTSVEADGLQDSLSEVADSFDVTGFKCVKCGLAHMHNTMKHRISDTFDVSEDVSLKMDYNSVCHCGLQEAGRRGSDFGIDESRAASSATNAPIPPEVSRQMNEEYGAL